MKSAIQRSILSTAIRGVLHTMNDRLFRHMARTGLIMTAIPLVAESLEAIPESQRELYAERDGKFHLDVTGLEDTSGLKSALDKERKAARDSEKSSAAWKALGKTPDEIKELLEIQRKADEEKLAGAGEWEKLKGQMVEQNSREKDELLGKLKAKDAVVERYLIDAQATAAISDQKGVPALLLPHVKASVKVAEDDNGELAVRIVDQAGNPRVNGKGEYLTIKDLISEMRESEVFGRAFEPSGTTGSGSQGTGKQHGKTISEAVFNALPAKQRAAKMADGFVVV